MTNHTIGQNQTAPPSGRDLLFERFADLFRPEHIADVLLNLGLFIGVILVGYTLGVMARKTVEGVHKAPTSGRLLAGRTSQFVFVLIALGVGLSAVYGVDPVGVMTAVGLVSLALGFGLQNTVANIAAGVGLTLDKPFDVGDRIRIGDTWGDVVSLGLRSTRIVTTSGEHVAIPNSVLDTQEVWNYTSRADRRMRLEIPISISYGSSIALAEHLMLRTVRGVEGVLAYPEPVLRVRGFGADGVELEIRCWIDRAQEKAQLVDVVLRGIKRSFDEHGVHFPFPQRTISQLAELPVPAPTPKHLEGEAGKRPVILACTRSASAALTMAAGVVRFTDQVAGRLVVLHVRPPQKAMERGDAQAAVNAYLAEAQHANVPAEGRMEVGDLPELLDQVARESGARLVVFGSAKKQRFGVVAWQRKEVMQARRVSPVPVVVLDPDREPDEKIVAFWREHLAGGHKHEEED